jgi:hypothetical protein
MEVDYLLWFLHGLTGRKQDSECQLHGCQKSIVGFRLIHRRDLRFPCEHGIEIRTSISFIQTLKIFHMTKNSELVQKKAVLWSYI